VQVPAKVYEYVGLRRTILALADEGAVMRIVRDGGFGVVVAPTAVDAIATALAGLYQSRGTLVAGSFANERADACDARRQSAVMTGILTSLLDRTGSGDLRAPVARSLDT
jgi:hypothetical protein